MKEIEIKSLFRVYDMDELSQSDRELVSAAMEATKGSYAPYSKFRVGAAARLANGLVFTGANQENAAYPSGLCAERHTLCGQCPVSRPASAGSCNSCPQGQPLYVYPHFSLWSLPSGDLRCGRPLRPSCTHPALWHRGHL